MILPDDWTRIPAAELLVSEPLLGRFTGVVPPGWTHEGWLLSLRDRAERTNEEEMVERLACEIRDIEAQIEAMKPPPGQRGAASKARREGALLPTAGDSLVEASTT